MPRPTPISDIERAELRRLYLAARRGTWAARTVPETQEHRLMAETPDGRVFLLGYVNRAEDAALAAAARNVLPRLFVELDDLRRRARPRICVEGTIS